MIGDDAAAIPGGLAVAISYDFCSMHYLAGPGARRVTGLEITAWNLYRCRKFFKGS